MRESCRGWLGICDLSENGRDGRRKRGIRKKSDNQKDRKRGQSDGAGQGPAGRAHRVALL